MSATERIRATLQRLAAGIDRLDSAVWDAERRQAWRDKHAMPRGEETKYERAQAAHELWQRIKGAGE